VIEVDSASHGEHAKQRALYAQPGTRECAVQGTGSEWTLRHGRAMACCWSAETYPVSASPYSVQWLRTAHRLPASRTSTYAPRLPHAGQCSTVGGVQSQKMLKGSRVSGADWRWCDETYFRACRSGQWWAAGGRARGLAAVPFDPSLRIVPESTSDAMQRLPPNTIAMLDALPSPAIRLSAAL